MGDAAGGADSDGLLTRGFCSAPGGIWSGGIGYRLYPGIV